MCLTALVGVVVWFPVVFFDECFELGFVFYACQFVVDGLFAHGQGDVFGDFGAFFDAGQELFWV